MFTKALDKGTFIKYRDVMMNSHLPLREALFVAVSELHGCDARVATRLLQRL